MPEWKTLSNWRLESRSLDCPTEATPGDTISAAAVLRFRRAQTTRRVAWEFTSWAGDEVNTHVAKDVLCETRWLRGERVVLPVQLSVPRGLAPGDYQLKASVYVLKRPDRPVALGFSGQEASDQPERRLITIKKRVRVRDSGIPATSVVG